MTLFRGRLADALASIRLAVLLIATLAAACIAATFYESRHGTPAAQRDFYQTGWFSALLALLGLNILFSLLKRYPWNRHQSGFVLAHLGILVLLAGSLLSLHRGLDGSMALYEGEESDRISLPGRSLFVALPGHRAHGAFPVDLERLAPAPGWEQRWRIPGSDAALVIDGYEPHVQLEERLVEGEVPNPALHFILEGHFGRQDAWLVASDHERHSVNFGPVVFALEATEGEAPSPAALDPHGGNVMLFVAVPGRLDYRLTRAKGGSASGPVRVGEAIQTPWMDLKVTVDKFLERAKSQQQVTPAPAPQKAERRQPAVRLYIEGPGSRSDAVWVPWGESRRVGFTEGKATLSFGAPEGSVPFRVTLLDFNSDTYPGSTRPASYESRVRVDDSEHGRSEHLIAMNRPLHYRGYTLFQSSFVEGQPMMSILSVTRAPGLPLVYLGTALISLGVAWMFYLKPYLARRQAARALALGKVR